MSVSRRKWIKYAGAGAAVAAIAGAGYYATRPTPTAPTPTSTLTPTPTPTSTPTPTPTPAPTPTPPKPSKLVVLGHKLHSDILGGRLEPGGTDLTAQFESKTGMKIEWVTAANPQIFERLFRETAAATSSINVSHTQNAWQFPRVQNLLEPLDKWMQQSPIEDFADFFEPMVKPNRIGGKLYGIPMRSTPWVMHYNKEIFEQQHVEPPRTMEDLYDIAKQVTFLKPTREKVYGFSKQMNKEEIDEVVCALARSWNGDLITPNFEVVIDQQPVINAVELLAKMYKDGILHPEVINWTNMEETNAVKEGRIAIEWRSANYTVTYNDPKTSKVSGKMKIIDLPPAKEFSQKWEGTTRGENVWWNFCIPANSQDKYYSWELIRHWSTKEAQLYMALQGNDPVRASVIQDPKYDTYHKAKGRENYKQVVVKALKYCEAHLPAFDEIAQFKDIFGTQVQAAIVGKKTAAQAMKDAAEAVRKIVPKP